MTKFDVKTLASSIQKRFDEDETIKSFVGFLEDVQENPHKYCRNSAQYLKDVFDHYGSYPIKDITGEEILRWKLFDLFRPVYGQEVAQNQIYNYVSSFAENRVNKIILLHGPNGAAKTSLVASVMSALEAYSRKSEGALFTFNWVFSDRAEKEVSLGFKEADNKKNTETLAFTDPEDITFKLPCGMKDNPLLLIPKKERVLFLKHLGLDPTHHLYGAELSQKSHEIFKQLAVSYKGDWMKIIRHVQVERFYFSKLFRKGLISIDAGSNVDANSRPLNLERSYRIPRILAMSSMYEPYGDLVDANRGMVEFSEIFKRHVNENKYLLTTAEWGTISLHGFTAQLDCAIFATDNEKTLSAFKVHPDWPSFNGRFAYVRIPYILKWDDEREICKKVIEEHVQEGMHVAPHTAEMLSFWGIMTRLRKSKHAQAKKLTFAEKVELYNTGKGPTRWPQKERQELERDLKHVANEFEDERSRLLARGISDASYEGRSGASYRDVENIVVDAIHKKDFLSPLSLFNTIEDTNKNESVYEFVRLRNETVEDYPKYEEGYAELDTMLESLKKRYCEEVRKDLQKSAGLISEHEYGKLFERYIQNVKAWIKHEKIKNPQTGAYEDPNERLMRKIEEKLEISSDDSSDRRREFFGKIAGWSLKGDVSQGVPYETLFSDVLEILRRNNDGETKKQLSRIQKHIPPALSDDWKLIPEDEHELVTQTIDSMLKHGYTKESLGEAVVFLINNEKD
jgi:predicted Ser/Thr protein kinase